MDIIEDSKESVTIVEVRGRIDSNTANLFGEKLLSVLKSGGARLVVDFRNIIYISSSGFRALLLAGKMAEENSGILALCGLSPEVKRLFDLGDFTDLFQIYPSREDCLAKLGAAPI